MIMIQGCKICPKYTCSERKPQMVPKDLNIGVQGLAYFSEPNLQPCDPICCCILILIPIAILGIEIISCHSSTEFWMKCFLHFEDMMVRKDISQPRP